MLKPIGDAIDRPVPEDGAQLTDHTELPMPSNVRSFNETMNEARELWNKIVAARGDEGKNKMHEIITNVFGHDVQLSKVTEDQQDFVELVIDDFKKLI